MKTTVISCISKEPTLPYNLLKEAVIPQFADCQIVPASEIHEADLSREHLSFWGDPASIERTLTLTNVLAENVSIISDLPISLRSLFSLVQKHGKVYATCLPVKKFKLRELLAVYDSTETRIYNSANRGWFRKTESHTVKEGNPNFFSFAFLKAATVPTRYTPDEKLLADMLIEMARELPEIKEATDIDIQNFLSGFPSAFLHTMLRLALDKDPNLKNETIINSFVAPVSTKTSSQRSIEETYFLLNRSFVRTLNYNPIWKWCERIDIAGLSSPEAIDIHLSAAAACATAEETKELCERVANKRPDAYLTAVKSCIANGRFKELSTLVETYAANTTASKQFELFTAQSAAFNNNWDLFAQVCAGNPEIIVPSLNARYTHWYRWSKNLDKPDSEKTLHLLQTKSSEPKIEELRIMTRFMAIASQGQISQLIDELDETISLHQQERWRFITTALYYGAIFDQTRESPKYKTLLAGISEFPLNPIHSIRMALVASLSEQPDLSIQILENLFDTHPNLLVGNTRPSIESIAVFSKVCQSLGQHKKGDALLEWSKRRSQVGYFLDQVKIHKSVEASNNIPRFKLPLATTQD